MTELAFQSTSALSRMLAAGEVTSVELLDLYAVRHEKYHSKVNAVIQSDFDRARDAAKAADALWSKGEETARLHGVPFTIKECFEVAGFRTTAGAPEWVDVMSSSHADAVQHLGDAGAIFMGKTNIPYMAVDLQSYNDVFGTTNNPWDLSRTCGGSSGGAGAALAAGLTGGEVGSDIGGSLRNPAHYNGVYAHKPSFDLIPMRGHVPPPHGALTGPDMGVVGPMGRSAEDLALGLQLMAKPAGINRHAPQPQLRRGKRSLEDFRVAIFTEHESNPLSKAVSERMAALRGALDGNVAKIEERWPINLDWSGVMELYGQLLLTALSGAVPDNQFRFMQAAKPLVHLAKALGIHNPQGPSGAIASYTMGHRRWQVVNEQRTQLRAEMDRFFEDFDVLLMPVMPWTAPPHDHKGELITRKVEVDGVERPYTKALEYIALPTMLYLPATVAPIGNAKDGLPVGVQIIAPYMQDMTAINFAAELAEVIGGFVPPPDFLDE